MENITEKLIAELQIKKIKLFLEEGKLKYKAPKGAMDKNLLEKIKEQKNELIAFLEEKISDDDKTILFSEILPVKKSKSYPLSAAQKRMFVLNRIDSESTAYNTTLTLKVEGELDEKKHYSVFKEITKRHESLRTTFGTVDSEPCQFIHDDVEFKISVEESNDDEKEIEEIIKNFIKPFDLSKLPIFRIKLIKIKDKTNLSYLVIDIHHIISDGVSGAIIINEINALLNGESLPEPKVHYKDYAAWHTKLLLSPLLKKEKEFYAKEFCDELPTLDLPSDFKRPAVFKTDGESLHFFADSILRDNLKKLARENKVTLFTVLLAVYNVLLSKYTGSEDIIVGTPVAGRIHEDTSAMCGIFLNTIPIRNYPVSEKKFTDFLREVGKNCIKTFDNQDYPFDKLVEDLKIARDPSRNPVFGTMFVMQNMDTQDMQSKNFRSSRYDIKHKMAQVDITVNVTETTSGIDFEFNYCSALFKSETIKRMISHFNNLLNSCVENSESKIAELSMMSYAEIKEIIFKFNETKNEDEETTLHALFEKSAESYPENIALFLGEKKLTYKELNEKANSLAHTLKLNGVKQNEIVGILADSSFESAVAILAVLKSGGAYLPIKTDFPDERIKFMLSDAEVKLVLTTKEYKEKVPSSLELLLLDDSRSYSGETKNLGETTKPNNLAYVIYTSGTTGKPKGVLVEHRTIAKTLKWRVKEYSLNEKDCVLQLFAYSFDGFLMGFFTPLTAGASVVMLEKNAEKDPFKVKEQIINHSVTSFISVPMIFTALMDSMKPRELKTVKTITLAGDKTPIKAIEKCENEFPWVELVNEYGPTESTVVSTIKKGMTSKSPTNIGKPCANTEIYILDKNNSIVPIGVAGELCVSGDRLARGYLKRPQLTAEKFIENPFKKGERLYKTGDMAKWRANGEIDFIGRTDFQVKIRGYRIETEEIENELSKYEAVKETVVIPRSDNFGNKYICAYIVPNTEFTVLELRTFLESRLPEYEIPSKFVKIAAIPLTTNGKLDRKALPEPDNSIDIGEKYVEPKTEIQKKIAEVWEKLLNAKNIGCNSNFFEVGGDSMSIIKLREMLDEIYPDVFSVTDLFTYATISRQSEYVEKFSETKTDEIKENNSERVNKDIAIIGMALNLPNSSNLNEFWNNICAKKSFAREMPKEREKDAIEILKARGVDPTGKNFEKLAYIDDIDKFDCEFFNIPPAEAELMDPNQRLFLQSAYSALEDAGYAKENVNGKNVGVFVGFGGDSEYGRFLARVKPQLYSLAAAGNLTSVIAGRVSFFLNLKGPAVVLNTACSSSLVAIHEACNSINRGECKAAIAGGVKIFLDSVENEFSMGIESFDGKTKTFDENCDGTIKGEGVAAIILKPLDEALADKDSIYAVIKGSAVNQDGTSNGITAPNPESQEKVIEDALKNAGVSPETIGLIEAHGTGTKLGDPIEIDSISRAYKKFTDKKQFCAISSLKSNMGHLDNAAGVAGVIKAALALKFKELPPTANFESPNKRIDFVDSPVFVNDRAKSWQIKDFPRRSAVSAFALCGTNCHMILEESPENTEKEITEVRVCPNILVISAMNKEGLVELIKRIKERYISGVDSDTLRNLCYTLATGRSQFAFRAAILFKKGETNLCEKLDKLIKRLDDGVFTSDVYFDDNFFNAKTDKNSEQIIAVIENEAENLLKDSAIKDNVEKLSKICFLFAKGTTIDFSPLFNSENRIRLNAPTYPFKKRRCWTDLRAEDLLSRNDRFYKIAWDSKLERNYTNSKKRRNVLIICEKSSLSLANLIRTKCDNGVIALIDNIYAQKSSYDFSINNDSADITKVFSKMSSFENITVVSLLGLFSTQINKKCELETAATFRAKTVLAIFKAFANAEFKSAEFVFVSETINCVSNFEKRTYPQNAILSGLCFSAALECPNAFVRVIDSDEKTDNEILANEILCETVDVQTAFRDNVRYNSSLVRADIDTLPSKEIAYSENGVYLITGGLGRIGFETAKHLAKKGKLNIALLSRRSVQQIDDDERKLKIEEEILKVNSIGSNLFSIKCDITDEKALEATLNSLREKYGRINGIFNCAANGVGKFTEPLKNESLEKIIDVLSPKVFGTFLFDKLTRTDKPDFFVNFSSGITLTGGFSNAAYAAANSFLDSFAEERAREGIVTLSVDWPVFKKEDTVDDDRLMFEPIEIEDALSKLDLLLEKRISRVIVGKMNFESDALSKESRIPTKLCKELSAKVRTKETPKVKQAKEAFDSPKDKTQVDVAELFCEVLGYEKSGIYDDFFELGGNSLLAVSFINKFEKKFQTKLSMQTFYENPTVEKLAEILNQFKDESEDSKSDDYVEISL